MSSMNPFQNYHLLSESNSGECSALVIERKRILRYVDEQNRCGVPSELVEAGRGF